MKRLILLSLCIAAAAAVASAEVRALYRIVMADGTVVLSRDLPRTNGSVTTFHASQSGVLTGVPSEQVVKVETSVTPRRFPVVGPAAAEESDAEVRPLEPGEAIDLGPMGDGGSGVGVAGRAGVAAAAAPNGASANGAYANGAYANGVGGYPNNGTVDSRMFGGGAAAATGLLPNGQPANQAIAGDILRAQSGNVPTMSLDTQTQTSPNGFPATVSSQTAVVNADGTVNTTAAGPVPGATAPIGPNGFPGTPQNAIGQNGFPGVAAQPAVGPNGFPGTPQTPTSANGFPTSGANGVVTDSNGFPVSGTAAGSVGPNGFPNATGTGTVVVAPNGTVTNVAPNGGVNTGQPANAPQQRAPQAKSGTKAGAAPSGPGGHGH